MSNPEQFTAFHGTPNKIHDTERPFLDPKLTVFHNDDGDPMEPHVFATGSLLKARGYAFKTADACGMSLTKDGLALIYDGVVPNSDKEGFVYELNPEGFKETKMADGRGTGKLVIVESDMPCVRTPNGTWQRGILVGKPKEQLTPRHLAREFGARIFKLDSRINRMQYAELARSARRAGNNFDETDFIAYLANSQLIINVTPD